MVHVFVCVDDSLGMLPLENMLADYVKKTQNHVLYRVTPIFDGDNLLATGVLMEALSMEDRGEGICFNVFCYNEQPGVTINHANGASELKKEPEPVAAPPAEEAPASSYIANRNTNKLHYHSCSSVKKMNEDNKVCLECTREQALLKGYVPCKNCNP